MVNRPGPVLPGWSDGHLLLCGLCRGRMSARRQGRQRHTGARRRTTGHRQEHRQCNGGPAKVGASGGLADGTP